MKLSAQMKDRISKNNSFYKKKVTPHTIYNHQFEKNKGNKEGQTFRKKKSHYVKTGYSSITNPLCTRQGRYTELYRITMQKKKKVVGYSDKLTDPLTLSYEKQKMISQNHEQFHNSLQYMVQMERKNELPAARKIIPTNKFYHHQQGYSWQGEYKQKIRNNSNSYLMWQILNTSQINSNK